MLNWIRVVSATASGAGRDINEMSDIVDPPLVAGDVISPTGDIYRNGVHIGYHTRTSWAPGKPRRQQIIGETEVCAPPAHLLAPDGVMTMIPEHLREIAGAE